MNRKEQRGHLLRLPEDVSQSFRRRLVEDKISLQSFLESAATLYCDREDRALGRVIERARILQEERH